MTMAAGHDSVDPLVRLRAFAFLEELSRLHGEALPREKLVEGFEFHGTRVPLMGPQGIFKPAILRIPISMTTVPIKEGKPRPYDDEIGTDGLIRYRYRGTDPQHRENTGLRLAMVHKIPLVYFYGLVPGRYAAEWPVYVVGDDPSQLCVTLAVDEKKSLATGPVADQVSDGRRMYVTTMVQQRLHQRSFRDRVLRAYRECCAVCRLRHVELLDAAHILPDGHPKGEPWVSNGIALCKLHHAAFDNNILGITPKLLVEIRSDVLIEKDGPMLMHGLQELHGKKLLVLPHQGELRPKADFLAERYELFLRAV
jgi:putative restriction endonuclease